jgi:beta-glucosidase
VSQLYVQYPDAADQPVRQLRGFERTMIPSSATASVSFSLRRRDLSMWDAAALEWAVLSGDYVFSVGASLRDPRLLATLSGPSLYEHGNLLTETHLGDDYLRVSSYKL